MLRCPTCVCVCHCACVGVSVGACVRPFVCGWGGGNERNAGKQSRVFLFVNSNMSNHRGKKTFTVALVQSAVLLMTFLKRHMLVQNKSSSPQT